MTQFTRALIRSTFRASTHIRLSSERTGRSSLAPLLHSVFLISSKTENAGPSSRSGPRPCRSTVNDHRTEPPDARFEVQPRPGPASANPHPRHVPLLATLAACLFAVEIPANQHEPTTLHNLLSVCVNNNILTETKNPLIEWPSAANQSALSTGALPCPDTRILPQFITPKEDISELV